MNDKIGEQGSKATGGFKGKTLPAETFTPPVELPTRTEEVRTSAEIHNAKLLGDKTTADCEKQKE